MDQNIESLTTAYTAAYKRKVAAAEAVHQANEALNALRTIALDAENERMEARAALFDALHESARS